MAKEILADFSLLMGFLIMSGFAICGFLFFGQDINTALYKFSGGKFGKPAKSLLPVAQVDDEDGPSARARKKGRLPPGWAKVTVQTSAVSQKKDMEVADCESLDELRELIWDEFGHVLKSIKVKNTVVMVWASDDDTGDARWMLVTEASDMSRVVRCGAIKLRDKAGIDVKALAVAFLPTLTNKKGKAAKGAAGGKEPAKALKGKEPAKALKGPSGAKGGKQLALKHKKAVESESESEEDEEESDEGSDAPSGSEADGGAPAAARAKRGGSKLRQPGKPGGFERLRAKISEDDYSSDGSGAQDDESSEDDAPLCNSAPNRRSGASCKGGARGRAGNRNKDTGKASSNRETSGNKHARSSGGRDRSRSHSITRGGGGNATPSRRSAGGRDPTTSSSKRSSRARAHDSEDSEDSEDVPSRSSKRGKPPSRAPPKTSAKESKASSSKRKSSRARDSESESDDDDAPSSKSNMVGKRVEVHGLVGKAELNGRKGTAMTFDAPKGRYRVRLDARKGGTPEVLAFKADNLRLARR